jgi:hypothetical protein
MLLCTIITCVINFIFFLAEFGITCPTRIAQAKYKVMKCKFQRAFNRLRVGPSGGARKYFSQQEIREQPILKTLGFLKDGTMINS